MDSCLERVILFPRFLHNATNSSFPDPPLLGGQSFLRFLHNATNSSLPDPPSSDSHFSDFFIMQRILHFLTPPARTVISPISS